MGIGNDKFPNSRSNLQWQQHQLMLKELQVPPFIPKPVLQIILFIIWLVVFLVVVQRVTERPPESVGTERREGCHLCRES